eukprot:COSAG03_NODE_17411_length_376_cov_0.747292_2_plen_24_part_01
MKATATAFFNSKKAMTGIIKYQSL